MPIAIVKTTPTRKYVDSVVLTSAKDIADKTTRFKYISVSMVVVILLLYIWIENQNATTTIRVNVMIMARRLLGVPPSEFKEKRMYKAQRTRSKNPVQ